MVTNKNLVALCDFPSFNWLAVSCRVCGLVAQSDAPVRKKKATFDFTWCVTKNKRDGIILSDAAEPMVCPKQHQDPGNRK